MQTLPPKANLYEFTKLFTKNILDSTDWQMENKSPKVQRTDKKGVLSKLQTLFKPSNPVPIQSGTQELAKPQLSKEELSKLIKEALYKLNYSEPLPSRISFVKEFTEFVKVYRYRFYWLWNWISSVSVMLLQFGTLFRTYLTLISPWMFKNLDLNFFVQLSLGNMIIWVLYEPVSTIIEA